MFFLSCSYSSPKFFMEGKNNVPGSTTDLGQGELDTPDLTLVAETVLANELQLGVTIALEHTMSVFGSRTT
jgi:hypothetical protein